MAILSLTLVWLSMWLHACKIHWFFLSQTAIHPVIRTCTIDCIFSNIKHNSIHMKKTAKSSFNRQFIWAMLRLSFCDSLNVRRPSCGVRRPSCVNILWNHWPDYIDIWQNKSLDGPFASFWNSWWYIKKTWPTGGGTNSLIYLYRKLSKYSSPKPQIWMIFSCINTP